MSAPATKDDTYSLRVVGHGGTAVLGALMLVMGVMTFATELPMVLAVAQVLFGALAIALAYASWNGSRIGWAFACALDGVFGLSCLFGAPKIAHLLATGMVLAALPSILAAVSCICLALVHADYDK
jgi:hypothetical protein